MPKTSSGSVRIFYPRYSRDEIIQHVRERMAALQAKLPVVRVVLFGSYATGRQTAFSDIDMLVVYAGAPRSDAFALVKKTIELYGLEPHVYTRAEAEAMAPTVQRMTRDGIVVFDAEYDTEAL